MHAWAEEKCPQRWAQIVKTGKRWTVFIYSYLLSPDQGIVNAQNKSESALNWLQLDNYSHTTWETPLAGTVHHPSLASCLRKARNGEADRLSVPRYDNACAIKLVCANATTVFKLSNCQPLNCKICSELQRKFKICVFQQNCKSAT